MSPPQRLSSALRFAAPLLAGPLERAAGRLIGGGDARLFATPHGEPALLPPDAVSWQIFRNPVAMYVGGIAAVLLELGEPRVREAVWRHSDFRRDPARRLRRTGMAAMITVYAARSRFEALAAQVRGLHGAVHGVTAAGEPYRADDPLLLRWVQGTAAFAFLAAFEAHVRPLAVADRARFYAEGRAGGALYGVTDVADSPAAVAALLHDMAPRLTPSPILDELVALVRDAAVLPAPLRPLQHVVVRAAVDLLPGALRARLALERHGGLSAAERALLRLAGQAAQRAVLPGSPASQACVRLGLPRDYLVRGAASRYRGWT